MTDAALDAPTALALRNEVRRRGLLMRRPGWYTANLVGNTLLYAGVVVLFVWTKSLWCAPLLAYAFYQLGLLFHDFGHYQAYDTRSYNDWAGIFTGFLIGGSIARWRRDHDAHHGHTNDLARDPDTEGPLAHTAEQARERRGAGRFFARTQHLWILPLSSMVLMPIIRSKDIAFVVKHVYPRRAAERLALALHYALYFWMVFGLLPVTSALLFIAVHQTLFGTFFTLVFLSNHTGMPVRTGRAKDFVAMQIASTRNVAGGAIVDYLLGPLGPHIEHHVFPAMARPNQRAVSELLRAYAKAAGVEYRECAPSAVHLDLVRSLRRIGAHTDAHADAQVE